MEYGKMVALVKEQHGWADEICAEYVAKLFYLFADDKLVARVYEAITDK